MGQKQIDVTCPCCSTRLTVDVLTRTVLRSVRPDEVDATGGSALDEGRWDSAADRVKGRRKGSEDKLDQALAEERGKEARLDDLFLKARKKLSGDEPESR